LLTHVHEAGLSNQPVSQSVSQSVQENLKGLKSAKMFRDFLLNARVCLDVAKLFQYVLRWCSTSLSSQWCFILMVMVG